MNKPELSPSALAGVLRLLATAIERGLTNYHEYERLIGPYVHYERRIIQLTKPSPVDPKKPLDNPILLVENGVGRPMGVVRRVEGVHPVTRSTYQGPDVKYLRRFAKLPRPTRTQWVGKITTYNQCARIFRDFGYTEKRGKINKWVGAYTLIERLDFCDQFDPNRPPKPLR